MDKVKVNAGETPKKFRFEEMLDRISEGFVALDKNWCYTYMNKKAGEIFNRDPEKMIGKHIWTEFPDGVGQPFQLAYEKAMKEQQYVNLVEYYPPYDKWFENHIYPSAEGLTIYFRDITERKKAEINLQLANQRLMYHLNNSPLGVIEWDKNFIIKSWSDRAEKIFGWKETEALNKHFSELNLVYEKDAEVVATIANEMMTGVNQQSRIINRNYTKNGKVIYCEWFSSVLKDEEGNIFSIMSLIEDLTEQKEAEKEILRGQKQLQFISDEIPFFIALCDTDKRYKFVNKPYAELFGLLPRDIIGKHTREILGEEAFAFASPYMDKALKGMKAEYDLDLTEKVKMPGFLHVTYVPEINTDKTITGFIVAVSDITESKKVNERLIEQENQLRLFIDNSPVALIMLDKDMRYLQASKKWIHDFNIENENLVGKSHYEIFPEIPEHWKEVHRRCLAGATEKKEEELFVRADGSKEWIHWEVHPWYKSPEEIGGIIIFSETISERKKAEKKMIESEEKYRTLVEQAVDGILIADLDGKIITTNSACSVLSGYSNEELLQMTIYDLAIIENLAKNPFQLATLKQGNPARSERPMKRKDGSVIQIEINAKKLLDGRLLIFVRDISERKKAQEKIIESENRLRTILETEPECVKLLNQKGEIVEMNPAGLAMIEAESLGQVKGQPVLNIINKEYQKSFSELTKNVFLGKPGNLEFEITGLKGTPRWLETHAVPLRNPDGTIGSLLGVTRDITVRKRAEKKIIQLNQELEQKVKERTAELEIANAELQEVNDLFLGREARIIELKEELKKLKES